jgi:hypothetical protein
MQLAAIDTAQEIDDINLPGFQLHSLKGSRIELTPSAYDPWNEVPVKRMLGGFYSVGDNSMLHGRVLKKLNELEFVPYSFLKYEFDQYSAK